MPRTVQRVVNPRCVGAAAPMPWPPWPSPPPSVAAAAADEEEGVLPSPWPMPPPAESPPPWSAAHCQPPSGGSVTSYFAYSASPSKRAPETISALTNTRVCPAGGAPPNAVPVSSRQRLASAAATASSARVSLASSSMSASSAAFSTVYS